MKKAKQKHGQILLTKPLFEKNNQKINMCLKPSNIHSYRIQYWELNNNINTNVCKVVRDMFLSNFFNITLDKVKF